MSICDTQCMEIAEGNTENNHQSMKTKNARKSLQFLDHTYNGKNAEDELYEFCNFDGTCTPDKEEQRRSPRKSVSDWLSETVSLSNEKQIMDYNTKKAIIIEHVASMNKLAFNGASIHFKKSPSVLSNWDMEPVVNEMKLHLPFLYCLLEALVGNTGSKYGTISLIYGMIMHSWNKQASLMQRLLSTLLMKNNASNKLMTRLNKLHLTLTGDSKVNLVKEFGKFHMRKIVQDVSNGRDGKLNGDNVDIFVRTNDIRMNNANKDYHFFATDWTPYRLNEKDFQENTHVQDIVSTERSIEVSAEDFLVTDREFDLFLEYLSLLLGRVMNEKCIHFKWLHAVLPKHKIHSLSEIMERRTVSHRLPILLKNEAKYDDCIQIMDSYIKQLTEWYNSGGRGWNVLENLLLLFSCLVTSCSLGRSLFSCFKREDFKSLKIPVGGDQLTRVRLQGAKALRAGAHLPEERFDNLYPMVVEFFHTVMDFVEKMMKKFMKPKSGRDLGTLEHLKIQIHRTNVNGNVKSRFSAHEDFVLLIGEAYFLEYALSYFGMETLDSAPTVHIDEGISRSHLDKKTAAYETAFKALAVYIAGKHTLSQPTVCLEIDGHEVCVPVVDDKALINISIGNEQIKVAIPCKTLTKPTVIHVSGKCKINVKRKEDDDLFKYVAQYLHWYSILLTMKDAISEGNILMINIVLKMMIPCFFAHSELSKYFSDCIDFILKTEHLLEPKLALQVRISSFVNPFGGMGHNKPADLEKENQVKELKKLIKGLGANKTENSITQISKAAQIINEISRNFDCKVSNKSIKTTHKTRSHEDDLKTLLEVLKRLKPFVYTPGRHLATYRGVKGSVHDELCTKKDKFIGSILCVVNRLKRDLPVDDYDLDSD